MGPASFYLLLNWLSLHSYFFIFLAMVAEGPLVTIAASFAAGAGLLNIFIILGLSILGDVIADFAYYAIGYWGLTRLFKKRDKFFGLSSRRSSRLKGLLYSHTGKTLLVIKLTPFLPLPGLISAGSLRIPFRKYLLISLAITLPKVLFFATFGYYSARAHIAIVKYLRIGQYSLFIGLVVIFLINYIYQKVSNYIAEKVEKV